MQAQVSPTRSLSGRIDPPSSKNYTTRYLLAAALAAGESIVRFPASSDDASAMRRCLRELGAKIEEVEDEVGPLVSGKSSCKADGQPLFVKFHAG